MDVLSSIIVVTAERAVPDEAGILAGLVEAGCQRLHLRRPYGGKEALAQLVQQLDSALLQNCTLHGPREWALEWGCGGYHHPQAVAVHGLRASRSWHSLDEPSAVCDYGFLSPVFPSISKSGYVPRWTLDQFQAYAPSWPCPVYALGGITPARLPALRAAGARGIAILGWLWQEGQRGAVLARWQEIRQAWQESLS